MSKTLSLVLSFLLTYSYCNAEHLTIDSLRIVKTSRAWNAFLGKEKIDEVEMFTLCENEEAVKLADEYQQDRARGILIGGLLSISGGAIAASAFNTHKNLNQTYLISGAIVSSSGLFFLLRQLSKSGKLSSYETAREVADVYNMSYR
jgi:hypothetical protein